MITTNGSMIMENGQYKKAEKLFGLSTDTKPTDIGNGSLFIAVDTGKEYLFDAAGSQWHEYSEGGGGGGDITVESKSISANGTYTAPTGKAYSPVTVNVANSYTAGDEGKVVSGGALVSQTAHAEVTENGTIDTTLNNSVVVNVQGGGGGTAAKQINFIDYDGTILHSYSKAEFNALSDLPENPTHTGLTSQGWNWTKAEISAQLTACPDGDVWIGQMYVTSDGTTQIDFTLEAPYLSPWLELAVNGTVDVDWGDGSAHDTVTGTSLSTVKYTQHVYAAVGSYTIKISVTSGSFTFYASSNSGVLSAKGGAYSSSTVASRLYSDQVKAIRIGSGVTSIGIYAFQYCCALQSVTIPSTVTSIGGYAFQYCYALQSVTIPSTVTSIGNYTFNSCYALQSVAIPSTVTSIGSNALGSCYVLQSVTIPSGVTSISSNMFSSCYALQSVAIPSTVTSIGSSAFGYCYALQSVTIPSSVTSLGSSAFNGCFALQSVTIPSGVTSIGNGMLSSCYALQSVTIPSGVTSIGNNVFSSCYALQSVTIPSTVTSMGTGVFSSCYALQSVTIPSTVTSIGSSVFNSCYALQSVTVPSGVNAIAAKTFQYCYTLTAIHFLRSSPATVENSDAFGNLPTDCIIYVPTGSLNAYKTASNYPNPNTYTYVEE